MQVGADGGFGRQHAQQLPFKIERCDGLLRAHPDEVQLVPQSNAAMEIRRVADAGHAVQHALQGLARVAG